MSGVVPSIQSVDYTIFEGSTDPNIVKLLVAIHMIDFIRQQWWTELSDAEKKDNHSILNRNPAYIIAQIYMAIPSDIPKLEELRKDLVRMGQDAMYIDPYIFSSKVWAPLCNLMGNTLDDETDPVAAKCIAIINGTT